MTREQLLKLARGSLLAPGAIKRLVLITAAITLAGGLYASFAPKWYRSAVTVVPAKAQKSGISGMLPDLGSLAGGLDASLGGGADVQRIAAVLQGTAVTDAVIENFDLKTRYGEKYQETTRDEVWKHCWVKALPKPNLVELSCEDKDPKFVQQLLAYFADYGNQVFRRVGVSSAVEQVRFLEKRVAELRQQANETSDRMRAFQEKHQIVDIDSQTKAVVAAMASLESRRMGKQLELDYARTFSAADESSLQQLRSQLGVINERLRDMEEPDPAPVSADAQPKNSTAKNKRGGASEMFPAALSVPKLRSEFEVLYRDRKVSEATLIFALERLESARADEARDTSTFLVMDPPALPTRHIWPRRGPLVGGAFVLGLLIAVMFQLWSSGALATLLSGRGVEVAASDSGPRDEFGVRRSG